MVSRFTGFFRRKMNKGDLDCKEVRQLSSDYIDGELHEQTSTKVKVHLRLCPPCNALIRSLIATVGLLRDTPKRKAPDEFKQRLRDNLQRH